MSRKTGKWPFDSATTIALLALLLSAVQFIVTAPLFSELLFSPEIVIRGSTVKVEAEQDYQLSAGYKLTNEGNATATNIEVGMQLGRDQKLSAIPDIISGLTEDTDNVIFKSIKIKIDRLLPEEEMLLLVVSISQKDELVVKLPESMGSYKLPRISYIRHAEGVGKMVDEPLFISVQSKEIARSIEAKK